MARDVARSLLSAVILGLSLPAMFGPVRLEAQPVPGAREPANPGPAHAGLRALDVPFVAQPPALCGGASLAMVLGYWGIEDVAADDFASLVELEAGGIPTGSLTAAVADLGWTSIQFVGDRAIVEGHLRHGRPVVVLIDDGGALLHYVVVVGWHEEHVVVHDPARSAFMSLDSTRFLRAWRRAGSWSLLVLPPRQLHARGSSPAASPEPLPASQRSHDVATCESWLSGGVRLARRHELGRADAWLQAARLACPDAAAPLRELAAVRLLQQRWTDAERIAREATRREPDDRYGWELLGASRFAADDPAGALAAWNRLGWPRVDGLQVRGSLRTHDAVIHRASLFEPGDLLTAEAWRRAHRRLHALPTIDAARLAYTPASSRTHVQVDVVERPLLPSASPPAVSVHATRVLVDREVQVDVSSPLRAGERWTAAWRWWDGRSAAGLSFAAPSSVGLGRAGVVRVGARWEEQTFAGVTHDTREPATVQGAGRARETRLRGTATLSNWVGADTRFSVTTGLERWSHVPGRHLLVGARLERRLRGDRVAASVDGRGWLPLGGSARFATLTTSVAWRSSNRATPAWSATGGFELASGRAPASLWPGAGLGRARTALLRAHPLIGSSGSITGAMLGRRLVHVSLEHARRVGDAGPLRLAAAAFVDAARAWRRSSGRAATGHVDMGLGLRLGLAGQGERLRVDVARGLRDGALVTSVAWALPWPGERQP